MTPKLLMTEGEVRSQCAKINLEVRNDGTRLMIYAVTGSLLRGFQLWFRNNRVDADDFANWWRFMGYDK